MRKLTAFLFACMFMLVACEQKETATIIIDDTFCKITPWGKHGNTWHYRLKTYKDWTIADAAYHLQYKDTKNWRSIGEILECTNKDDIGLRLILDSTKIAIRDTVIVIYDELYNTKILSN